jgi:hypothetical protein
MVKEKKEKEIKKGNTATEIGNVPLKFPKSSHPSGKAQNSHSS